MRTLLIGLVGLGTVGAFPGLCSLEADLYSWLKETNHRAVEIKSIKRQGDKVVLKLQPLEFYFGREIETAYQKDHPEYDPSKASPFMFDGFVPGYTREVEEGPVTLVLPLQARVVLYDYPGHIGEHWVTNAGYLERIMTKGVPAEVLNKAYPNSDALVGAEPTEEPEKYPNYYYLLRRQGGQFRELIQIYEP